MKNLFRLWSLWICAIALVLLPLIVRAQTSTPPTGTGYVQIVGNTIAGVPITVQVDANGVLATSGGGGGGGGTSSTFGAAFPATGTALGISDGTNMVALLKGQTTMAGSIPVAIASNQSALPVTGTFWQATQPVSGNFFQATQPVSIAATITANAIQSGTWNIGTVTTLPAVTQGTAAAIAGGGWPILNGEFATDTTGTFTNGTQTNSVTTGSSIDGYATVAVSITGTYGTASAVFEMSDDGGTTWYPTSGVRSDSATIEAGYTTLTNTSRVWFVSVAGMDSFRVRSTAVASGTVNVRFSISSAPVGLQSTSQLAAGANIIGALTANQSVNQTQVNGVAVSTNLGAADTGTQRVTVDTDQVITGAAAQTATVNNIIPTSSGATSTDVTGFQSGSIQLNSTGTAGTYILEGSNDDTTFVTIPMFNKVLVTGLPITASVTASSSTIIYTFPIDFRRIRLRIATTITGGSIQAITDLRHASWTPVVTSIASPTTANNTGNSNVVSLNGTAMVTGGVAGIQAVGGNVAISAAATANPLGVGGRVTTTLDTSLLNGDVAAVNFTDAGQVITKDYGSSGNDWTATSGVTPLATTTSTALKAAGAASIRNYVTGLQFYNNSATVSTNVSILDGASVIWTGQCPATTAALPIVAIQVTFPTPLRGTAATAMNIQCGTTGSSVTYNVQGYQSF